MYVELNSNFIFRSNACFSRRLDPEVGLLDEGLAGVTAVFQGHVVLENYDLPQSEVSDNPTLQAVQLSDERVTDGRFGVATRSKSE